MLVEPSTHGYQKRIALAMRRGDEAEAPRNPCARFFNPIDARILLEQAVAILLLDAVVFELARTE